MILFLNAYHGNKKYHSRISNVSNYLPIKFHVRISSTDVIIQGRYCRIVHLSFLTSHNLLLFSFFKTSKNNIFGFSVFFLTKFLKYQPLIEYLEKGLADFNDFGIILQDFERPFR